MKNIILSSNTLEINNFNLEEILSINKYKNFELIFNENVLAQIVVLRKISTAFSNLHIYIQTYGYYQDMLGALDIPNWYQGRLIIPKNLGSVVLEFKYNNRFFDESSKSFIYSLFLSSRIYISKLNPQKIQEYYYSLSEEKVIEYLDNFVGVIDIDNDGSYMRFTNSIEYDLESITNTQNT